MKFFKIFCLSLLSSIAILFLLIFTREYFLNYVLDLIKSIKGTSHYQGETKAADFIDIMTYIISPLVFLISFVIINKKTKK